MARQRVYTYDHPIVSAAEKYEELERQGRERPPCSCHYEPMAWNADKSRPAGGKWVCSITRRRSTAAAASSRWHGAQLDKPCCYVIRAAEVGRVKIGHSSVDPRLRRDALQTGSPVEIELVAVLAGGKETERELQKRFAVHRVHGEWFDDAILPSLLREARNRI